MKKNLIKYGMTILFTLFLYNLNAQELQSALFNDVNRIRQNAIGVQANVLSPKSFEEAVKAYDKAKVDYLEDGDLADIRENINKSYSKFSEAIENSKVNAVLFSEALAARGDALNAEANQGNTDLWNDAEEVMRDAAKEFENGNSNDAKEEATKAVTLYRNAELEAIKTNYLANAKKLVEKAEADKVNKRAPKTLEQAKLLIARVEKMLADDRYDTDEARYLAKEAEYKAALAIHIASQVQILDEKDYEVEDYLLMAYDPLISIGENLDMYLKFDQGVAPPLSQVLSRIREDNLQNLNLETELYSKKQQNANYKQMLAEQVQTELALKDKLSDEAALSQKKQQMLQSKINENAMLEKKFDEIQRIFNATEAQVFRQKNDIIIRMIGVSFDVDKSEIKKENYATISKIDEVAGIFENASITIEGHTDSQGSDEANLTLSKNRADAVLTYLLASSKIAPSRFATIGFGENKPVSNNETSLGRKQNRRIDVVVRPTATDIVKVGMSD